MTLTLSLLLSALPICHAGVANRCEPTTAPPHRPSGARGATDTLGRGAWLIDEENDEVLLADALGVRRRVRVGAWPEQLVVDLSGRVFVSCRQAGRVDVISDDFRVESIPVGPEPRALALDGETGTLFVGTVTGRQLVSFDTRTLRPLASRPLPAPPSSLAVTGLGLAVVSDRDALISFYPQSLEGEPVSDVLETGGNSSFFGWDESSDAVVRPQWLVPRGDDLVVVSRSIATGRDAPSEGGGYGGGVSGTHQVVVHVLTGLSRGLPAPELREAMSKSDACAVTLHRDRLTLASRGHSRFSVIDLDVPAFTFNVMASTRIDQPSSHRALPLTRASWDRSSVASTGVAAAAALEDGRVLLLEPASRMLSISEAKLPRADGRRFIAFGTRGAPPPRPVLAWRIGALPESSLDPELRLGRALFHDAENGRLSGRRMPCASCHVDGREDGLVWEQNATFRQTPMLAGGRLAETAPFNWLGTAKTLEANIQQTVTQRLGGSGLSPTELAALARYVRDGLRPVTRPPATEPVLVAQGRAVFESAETGCAACHPAAFSFTDGAAHDVRSVGTKERETFDETHGQPSQLHGFSPRFFAKVNARDPDLLPRRFNTPALAHLAVTAPYLHDGSAQTLEELIAKNRDRMGATSHLSAGERRALVAYLESL